MAGNTITMKNFLKATAILALILLAWQTHQKTITYTVTSSEAYKIIQALEDSKILLDHSTTAMPPYKVTAFKDSVSVLQQKLYHQLHLQDSARYK